MAPKEGEMTLGGAVAGAGAAVDEFGWQASCSGLSARLGSVRARGLWADCEVLVGAARTPVRAHRVLLAAASPVLAAMLYGPLAPSDPDSDHKPLLPDLHVDTFHLLLEYMYTDNITISSSEVACDLYKAAHYLILPHVQMVSKTFLLGNLSSESEIEKVLSMYEFGELYDDKEIRDKCLELMSKKTAAVLKRVESVRAETLQRLFALPTLAIESELDLVHAAERWLHARCPAPLSAAPQENGANLGMGDGAPPVVAEDTKPKTTECDGLEDGNDPKMLIRDAVKEIRFLAMKPNEFASHDMSALLTESETLAIALNLLSDESHIPMPDGFSSSKESRKNNKITIKVDADSTDDFTSELDIIHDFPFRMYINDDEIGLKCEWDKSQTAGRFWLANIKVEALSRTSGVPNLLSQLRKKFKKGKNWYHQCQPLGWYYISDPDNGYVSEDGEVTFEVTIDVVAAEQ